MIIVTPNAIQEELFGKYTTGSWGRCDYYSIAITVIFDVTLPVASTPTQEAELENE